MAVEALLMVRHPPPPELHFPTVGGPRASDTRSPLVTGHAGRKRECVAS